MNKIYLIFTYLIIFSCPIRCQEETSPKQQKKYDEEEQKEIKICSKYAAENGYKKIGYQQFNERCKYFFGIDLDTVRYYDKNSYSVIGSNYDTECCICKDGQYL